MTDDDWIEQLPPLIRAAALGDTALVSDLLERGEHIDQCNVDGWTALHAATISDHPAVAQLLLTSGADVDLVDNSGRTPLLVAFGAGSELIKLLLDAGADPMVQEPSLGWRPLDSCADWSNSDGVALLIDAGVDVNAEDSDGDTALYSAAEAGCAKCVELLLDAGANPNIAVGGVSAAAAAARFGFFEVSRKIAAAAANTPEGLLMSSLSASNSVQFNYRLTGTGWAESKVTIGRDSREITASFLSDALGDLLGALLSLTQGGSIATVRWSAEQIEFRWVLERVGSELDLQIRSFPDEAAQLPDDEGFLSLAGICEFDDFLRAVVAGSRALLTELGEDGYKRLWVEHPFPTDALNALELHAGQPRGLL